MADPFIEITPEFQRAAMPLSVAARNWHESAGEEDANCRQDVVGPRRNWSGDQRSWRSTESDQPP